MPRISVVIPTRNRWQLLRSRALPCALEQEDVDREVIVVDDASTDATFEGLEALGDPRLRVVRRDSGRDVGGPQYRDRGCCW